jgi:hypothetical protein
MQYVLGNMLGRSIIGSLDPDAKLYIATVEAALGATIEAALPNATNPKKIISDFYRAEKDAGRYSLHKRLYLPIYNNLAANAVDAITRNSGTFAGTVTVAPGYVQGDGSTGYFDTLSRFDTLGITESSGYQFGLVYSGTLAVLAQIMGSGAGIVSQTVLGQAANAGRLRLRHSGTGTGSIEFATVIEGIVSGSRTTSNRSLYKRSNGSRSVLISTDGENSGSIPSSNVYGLAYNNTVTEGVSIPSAFSNVAIGAFGFGLGLTDSQDSGFTANLKTLWESLTGLTLP